MFNLDDITIGQMERFEQIAGTSFADFGNVMTDSSIPPLSVMKGVAYLCYSMDGRELSDAELNSITMKELNALMDEFVEGEDQPASLATIAH